MNGLTNTPQEELSQKLAEAKASADVWFDRCMHAETERNDLRQRMAALRELLRDMLSPADVEQINAVMGDGK